MQTLKINLHGESWTLKKFECSEEDLVECMKVAAKNEHAKEVRRILGLKQYEKMELVYRNDKHLIINNTRKEILKKQ